MNAESDESDDVDDTNGAMAQLVAQRIVCPKVASSSLVCSAKLGVLVELVNTLACHVRDCRFEPGTPRFFSFGCSDCEACDPGDHVEPGSALVCKPRPFPGPFAGSLDQVVASGFNSRCSFL